MTVSVRTSLESFTNRYGQTLWRSAVSDRSIEEWEPPADHLVARCFADVPARGELGARVRVGFDTSGKATAVEVTPDERSAITAAQTTCVRQAFLTAQAPCPAVPASTADAVLRVVIRPIGEKF